MAPLLAFFGLCAIYFIVHMYSNSTPPKNKDRRLSKDMNDAVEANNKARLEEVRRETREYLIKSNFNPSKHKAPLGSKGYRDSYKPPTPTRPKDTRRNWDDRDDIDSFFASPHTPISSPAPSCGRSYPDDGGGGGSSSSSDSCGSFD
ncbi:membrane protein [Bacillus phage Darren]|nr:membrane protein [Bacillus phage Darren]